MSNLIQADSIFINGNILTMDDACPSANSFVVKGEAIIFVGEQETALTFKNNNTNIIDLNGKTVMPGFVESHTHPTSYAINLLELDCRPSNASSIKELQENIAAQVKNTPPSEWIQGWGWDENKLAENRFPTRFDLDVVSPDHPVKLTRTCGHISVVNTKALELNGITEETDNPDGGEIQKDKITGELTGVLQEKAQGLITVPDYTIDDYMKGFKLAQKDFARWGITTLHDMSTQSIDMELYQRLLEDNELTVRVRPWLWAIDQKPLEGLLDGTLSLGIRSNLGNDMIKIQGMKFMLDGAGSGGTAAVADPYEGEEDNLGILLFGDEEDVIPHMEASMLNGLRIAVHAIGERAIDVVMKAFDRASEKIDITKMRNRIEHCGLPTDEHLEKMRDYKIVAASSVGFIYHLGDNYLTRFGQERMNRLYPHKSFKEYGIVAPGNSDLPVTDGDPWKGIYGAVTRKSLSGTVLDHVQGISVTDALKAYTVDGAYSSHEESLIGVIKPSAKADFIVISANPYEIDVEEIKDIEVESTFINGKQIYAKD